MTLKDADEIQIKLVIILKSLKRGAKSVEKWSSLNNIVLFLSSREIIHFYFRIKIFSTKNERPEQALEPTPKPTPKPARNLKVFVTPKKKYHH